MDKSNIVPLNLLAGVGAVAALTTCQYSEPRPDVRASIIDGGESAPQSDTCWRAAFTLTNDGKVRCSQPTKRP